MALADVVMVPSSAIANAVDRGFYDAELLGDVAVVPSAIDQFSNNVNVTEPKFSCSKQNSSALSPHVVVIGLIRSKEKMIWPNARRIVAAVQYFMAPFYRAKVYQPARSVCSNLVRSNASPEVTVPVRIASSGPQPAAISSQNVLPKSVNKVVRQALLKEEVGGSFDLHVKVFLNVPRLGLFVAAPGQFSVL